MRIVICLLLVSLNVVYAFDSHEGEFQTNFSSNTQDSTQDKSISSNDSSHEGVPQDLAMHSCHLGHCGFVIASYEMTNENIESCNFSSKNLGTPFPFIDTEIRPPILS